MILIYIYLLPFLISMSETKERPAQTPIVTEIQSRTPQIILR